MVGHHPDHRVRREGGRAHRAAARGRWAARRGASSRSPAWCSGRFSRRHTASDSSGARSGRRGTPRAQPLPAHRVARSADRVPRGARAPVRPHGRSPASPRRCSTPPSRRTPTRRRSPPPASRRRSIRRTSRCGTGSSRRCGSRSRTIAVGALVFWVTRAQAADQAPAALHRGRGLQRRAARHRAALGADDEPHPARIAAGVRRHDLRRVRRRRGHGAARGRRMAACSWTPTRRRCSCSSRRS